VNTVHEHGISRNNPMNDDTPRCQGTNRHGEQCGHPAGWGTENDDGPCKFHGGASTGAPEGNGNAQKHGLHADRGKFYDRLDEAKQTRVDELEAALIDRYEEFHGREPDAADVRDIFEIAVGYVQRDHARDWMADNAADGSNPMTEEIVVGQRDDGSPIRMEVPARLHETLTDSRREDRLMKKHMGLFRDPDTKQAEATQTLAEVLNG
jgi:hypothetical protein